MKSKISKIMGVALTVAMLVSLLLMAAPVSAAAPTALTVSAVSYVINTATVYTMTFTSGLSIPATGTIDVQFPAGTVVPATAAWGAADVSLQATAGFGAAVALYNVAAADLVTTAGTTTVGPRVTITLAALKVVGEGADVRIKFLLNKVTNTTTLGTAVVSIKTSVETTYVSSNTLTYVAPTVPAQPGTAKGYNVSGVLLTEKSGNNAISAALAVAGVVKVVVSDGTYDENAALALTASDTVESVNGAAVTIIADADKGNTGGNVTMTGGTTTANQPKLIGFTVERGIAVTSIATIQDCVISNSKTTVPVYAGGDSLDVDGSATTALLPVTSTGNTISAYAGMFGLDVDTGEFCNSTNDIINILATTTASGTAVDNDGTLKLTGTTITGASGVGVVANAGTTTVDGATLSNLDTALSITGAATVAVKNSTITGCGRAANTTAVPAITAAPVIDLAAVPTEVLIFGNTIADAVDEIMEIDNVAGITAVVWMNFNSITNPAKGIDNNENAAVTLDATNNWWGAATGPTVAMTPLSTTTGKIDITPYLPSAISSSIVDKTAAGVLDTQTVLGLGLIITDTGAGTPIIGMSTYATNPGTAAPTGTAKKYYDVYVPAPTGNVTIQFYGAGSTDVIYAWSASQGKWVACTGQVYDQFAGIITVTVTAISTPTLANLAALPFVHSGPAAVTAAAITPVLATPALGAAGVAVTPSFTWGAVANAVTYEWVLAEDLGAADKFAIIDDAATCYINAYVAAKQPLKYSTTYYWRVRTKTATVTSNWAVSLFTTMAEPEEVLPPVVIEETPDLPDITVELPPQAPPVIPDYLLWVIIGVGAVLVVAVIVLIVRTRRVV